MFNDACYKKIGLIFSLVIISFENHSVPNLTFCLVFIKFNLLIENTKYTNNWKKAYIGLPQFLHAKSVGTGDYVSVCVFECVLENISLILFKTTL